METFHAVLNNLGFAYAKAEDLAKGADHFTQSIKKDPDFPYPYYNLGIINLTWEKYDLAADLFSNALLRDESFLEARFNLGRSYSKQGEFRKAEQTFSKPIKHCTDFLLPSGFKKPKDAEARPVQDINEEYFKEWRDFIVNIRLSRQFRKYERNLRQAVSGDRDIINAWYDFGLNVYEGCRYPEAEKIFNKVASIECKYLDILNRSGTLYLFNGEYLLAAEIYLTMLDILDRYKNAAMMGGLCLNHQKRYPESEKIFEEILAIDSSDRKAMEALGAAYAEQNKFGGASKTYSRLKEIAPNDIDVLYNYSKILFSQKDYEQAACCLREILEKDKDFSEGWLKLGDCCLSLEQFNEAEDAYMRVVSMDENHLEANKKLCKVFFRLHKYINVIETVENVSPQDMDKDLRKLEGESNFRLGYFRKAEKIFSKLLESDKNNDHVLKLAKSLMGQNKYPDAERVLLGFLESEKEDEAALFNLGLVYDSLKRYKEAEKALAQASRLNPKNRSTWYYLGIVLGEIKRFEEAIDSFDKALELDREFKEAWNNKGVCAFKLKNYTEAEKYFRKAVTIDNDYNEAWYNLGICLNNLGKPDESAKALKRSKQITT